MGLGLHNLQIMIASRGIQLLKVGSCGGGSSSFSSSGSDSGDGGVGCGRGGWMARTHGALLCRCPPSTVVG